MDLCLRNGLPRLSNRQKAQDQRRVKMDHTLEMGESGESPVAICFPHSGTVHWHALDRKRGGRVDGCVFSPGQCSLNGVHLSPPACLASPSFSWDLPNGKVYIWQNEKEREIRPFPQRGMKELSRVPFKWQLNPRVCLSFREATFHRARLCSRSLMKASLISKSVTVCVSVCVCVFHRLNLHGDDVSFSQAPAVIRGGGGSVTQSSRGKKASKWPPCPRQVLVYWKESDFRK